MALFSNLIPVPPSLKAESSVFDLKSRLDWGEPALTIVDVRPRDLFNQKHIMGAVSMPMDKLTAWAPSSLEPSRDIYVYGGSEGDTAAAAAQLRASGFQNVAELRGGMEAWQAAGYPIENRPPAMI